MAATELPSEISVPHDASCGACLLELNENAGNQQEASVASRCSDRLRLRAKHIAALEGCQHLFHVRCILVWSEVENSCPQCRSRFRRFGEYNVVTGQLRKLCEVQQRDQVEQSSSEEIICDLCHRGDDDEFLLLCDGRQGRCPGACHSYCDGLGRQIPRGRWLCFACRPARQPAQPARRPKAAAKGRGRRAERQAEALLNATMAVNQLPVQPASADLVMSDAAHGTASQALPNVSVKVEQGKEMQLGHSERLPKQETIRPRVKRERPDAQPSGASAVDTTTDGDRSSAEPAAPEATVQQNAAINSLVKEELEEAEMEKFAGWDVDAKKTDMAKVKEEVPEMAETRPVFWKLQATQMSIDLDLEEEPKEEPVEAEEKQPAPRQRYHILQLPKELEGWAEQVRKFASTYFLCERSMPLANRTAERLWKLCQIGPCPAGFDGDDSCRQLLNIARDSFQLFWQQPLDPGDDDPCGLRCLRTKTQPLLCVRYMGPRGKRGKLRPSDIMRCELQCRRRLLELWDSGFFDGGFRSLPMVELPPEAKAAVTQGDIPRARAAVAVDNLVQPRSRLNGMDLVNALKEESWYFNQAVHVSQTAARTARFAEPTAVLHPLLKEVLLESLCSRGSSALENSDQLKLYSHQAEAIDAVLLNKQDVVVSTSTGSGKSLVYLTAIFDALLRREDATAILIFPTKALAQDQLRTLKDLAQALTARGVPEETLSIACLDGDTPGAERARVRKEARVVLTNPDMLHSHVLPQHIEYSRLLHNVCYVVLDEVHVYRGAFGANVCSVIRRLRRLVEVERTQEALQFVACSATVANPGEHLERLLGRSPPYVVARDGSPSGGHVYVLWNPMEFGPRAPKDDGDEGEQGPAKRIKTEEPPATESAEAPEDGTPVPGGSRSSPIVEVTRLLAWLVSRDVSVLAFCKWRSLVEIVLQDVKDALLASEAPALSSRVVSYRAGYPPALRRQLERDIFHRKVLGVACTNALELGIDIGRLDCTISLGFPGSVASLRQQFGRAGRAGRLGLSFYVAFDDPTDQHFMRRPRELLARRPESVAVAPSNVAVMRGHLPCAAAERPLESEDGRFWQSAVDADPLDAWTTALQKCLSNGTLEQRVERFQGAETSKFVPAKFWGLRRGPHRAISIRAVEDHFQVFEELETSSEPREEAGGFLAEPRRDMGPAEAALRKLDEIEISKAFYSLHPGAVYRYRGSEYNVMNLDVNRRRALVKKCDAPLPYYTRAFDSTVVRIQTRERHAVSGEAKVFLGEMELESRVKSFKRFWKSQDVPQEAEVELNLPSWGYTSRGLWFEDPLGVARPERDLGDPQVETPGHGWGCGWAGAHAAMHALLQVFPLFVLADRQDLDAACVDEHGLPPMDRPRLMIFDAKDGGLGLCDAAFPHGFAILREARRLVEDCPCENGCPRCIIDSHCREYNRLLSKRGALEWLKGLESGDTTDGRDIVP